MIIYLKLDYRIVCIQALDENQNLIWEKGIGFSGIRIYEFMRDYLKNTYHVLVGHFTVERIIVELATHKQIHVKGRNTETGIPHQIIIASGELEKILFSLFESLVFQLNHHIKSMPDEVRKGLETRGFIITGDYPKISNLDVFLSQKLNLSVQYA